MDIGESEVRQEKTLVKWSAKSRPFKKRSREFYVNLYAISALVGLILFLIEGIVPVILVVAILFLFYIFSTIEPEEARYELTTFGMRVNDQLIRYWEEMGLYWFSKKMGEEVLVIETHTMPWKLEVIIPVENKDKIKDIVSKKLYENETPETSMDRFIHWIGSKIK